jgi:hypothetical protein
MNEQERLLVARQDRIRGELREELRSILADMGPQIWDHTKQMMGSRTAACTHCGGDLLNDSSTPL